jgi:cell division septation protein DedD
LLIVGTALYNGDDVPADPVTAYAYVSRAAAQGLAPAQATLADMDAVMPLDQRQKGVALAQAMATGAKKSASTVSPPAKVAASKPSPAKAAPARPPAAAPSKPAMASAGGKWRIQLGAFGQRKSAEALFGKLSSKLGGQQAYYVPAGAVTRLQAGPFETRAAASAACARLAPQPCFPVAGP